MKGLIAWKVLVHEKSRSILAICGISVATLLIFMQLGFYDAVPRGGLLEYDAMRFDLLLTSSDYVYQANSRSFPRRRLYQAQELPEVVEAVPLYQRTAGWLNPEGRFLGGVFVMGFDLSKPVFDNPDISRQMEVLTRPDTLLVDTTSRSMFGPLTPGRVVEFDGREVEIGGTYVLGTGFVGLAAVVASDVNFARIFPSQSLGEVNLGLVRLQPGSDPNAVADKLRAMMPADTQVFTRQELYEREEHHWMMRTSTGPIFGFGVLVAVIVGVVILYQMLATQISHHLPQYATMKALGYTTNDLVRIIVGLALMMSTIAFVPAFVLATIAYHFVGKATLLPTVMTLGRMIGVLILVMAMSSGAALLSMRRLARADPADLF